jgi:hypothetical protein
MKVRDLNASTAAYELRAAARAKLSEAVNKHLTMIVDQLRAREGDDVDMKGIDVAQLAELITGLKVIGKRDFRAAITKDDIGVDPSNARDLFVLLDRVPDKPNAKLDDEASAVFKSLAALAPSMLKSEQSALSKLTSKDAAERLEAVNRLESLASKVDQMYSHVHVAATKAAVAKPAPTS